MYNEFYKLEGNPFRLNPDHRLFFVAEPHQKAIAHLEYALNRSEGFVVITGEVGAGKTTLVNRMLSRLEASSYITGNIVTSFVEHSDLIHLVASTFGVSQAGADKATLLLNIRAFLEEQRMLGRHPILFVDEVQNLPASSLEELRMLSNFSLPGESLLQIFLVGQPEFRATLADESMEQLRQRVITACHLGTLNVEDTRSYIAHRLRLSNWVGDPGFSARAFELIHLLSRGVPRRINQVCDRLLLYGYLEQIHRIDAAAVAAVARDMTDEGLITAPAAVLYPEDVDEDREADLELAEAPAASEEAEIQDTPLPESFLEELASYESAAAAAAAFITDYDKDAEADEESDPESSHEEAPEEEAELAQPLDEEPAEENPEGPEEDTSEPQEAEEVLEAPAALAEAESSMTEAESEEAAQTEETVEADADAPEETAESELGEAGEAEDPSVETEATTEDGGESLSEEEREEEPEPAVAAATATLPEVAKPVAMPPLYLPDEALSDGPTEGRARLSRRWPLAAGAALAASIAAALFAVPEEWVEQNMFDSKDLVVSQDLDLRTVSPGEIQLAEVPAEAGQGAVSDAQPATLKRPEADASKKGPYIVPAASSLDGGDAAAKGASDGEGAAPLATAVAAALPNGNPKLATASSGAPAESLPVEDRFLIQLATLRSQEEALQLRDRFEARFKTLIADFGLGVRHASIAGAQYFRVMTELGGERERMFEICSQIKKEDQSCILVLDTAAQAQVVN